MYFNQEGSEILVKRRYQEKINDRKFVILSDKDQSYVHRSVKELNQRLSEVSRAKPGISTEDTALLVALNLVSERYELEQVRERAINAERHFHEKELQWRKEIQELKAKTQQLEEAFKKKQLVQPAHGSDNRENKLSAVEKRTTEQPIQAERKTEVSEPRKQAATQAQGLSHTARNKKQPVHVSLERPSSTSSSMGSLFQGSSAALLADHSKRQSTANNTKESFKHAGKGLSRTKRKKH